MANKALLLFAVIVAVCGVAHSSKYLGKCPNVTSAKNFDVDAYMGVWYIYEDTSSTLLMTTNCEFIKYEKINSTSFAVSIGAGFKIFGYEDNFTVNIVLPAVVSNQKLDVSSFEDEETKEQAGKRGYLVLGTDYRTYAVGYSCTERTFGYKDKMLVLTRERKPDDSVILKARKIIEDNKLSTGSLKKVNQELCPDELKFEKKS